MKKSKTASKQSIALIILLGLGQSYALSATELGRFFTTAEERAMLDDMRYAPEVTSTEPEPEPVVEVEEVIIEEPEPEEMVEIPGITVNGVVYRRDGNSTAWLNGENTLEGDLESQYLHVDGRAIKGQKVPVEIKINRRELQLKPGQTYQPEIDRVIDSYSRPVAEPVSDEG